MKPQPRQPHALTAIAAIFAAMLGAGIPVSHAATANVETSNEATSSFERPAFMETSHGVKSPVRVAHGDMLMFDDIGISRTTATLQAVRSTEQADILLLDAGYNKRFLPGMVCQVRAADAADVEKDTAQIIIVETRADRAAALVLDLAPGATLAPGAKATLKLLDL
jgi:hypothetical protein